MAHRQSFEEDYEFEVSKNEEGGYSVSLPHQCDSWEIVGADVDLSIGEPTIAYTSNYPNLPREKSLAIAQMKKFIERAEEALTKLEQLP